jgi:hypothetical protein
VNLQTKVIELSDGEGDQDVLRASLDQYRAALKELGDPIVQTGSR